MIVVLALIVLAAIFVVVRAEVTNYVPKDAITVSQMFENSTSDWNTLVVTERGNRFMKVLFNGEPVTLRDRDGENSKMYLSMFGGISDFIWMEFDLIGENSWFDMTIPDIEYIVFKTPLEDTPYMDSMVFFLKDEIPTLVDASKWSETKATIDVFPHFRGDKQLVHNITTNEVAFVYMINTFDDQHLVDYISQGQRWGYIHIEDYDADQFVDPVDAMYLSQSEPDLKMIESSLESLNAELSTRDIYGPANGCYWINRDSVKLNLSKNQLLNYCGVYANSRYLNSLPD